MVRPGGVFAFTTKVPPLGSPRIVRYDGDGIAGFLHGLDHVKQLAAEHGFAVLKAMRVYVGDELAGSADVFCAFVTRCTVQ